MEDFISARIWNKIISGVKQHFNEEITNNNRKLMNNFCSYNELCIIHRFLDRKEQYKGINSLLSCTWICYSLLLSRILRFLLIYTLDSLIKALLIRCRVVLNLKQFKFTCFVFMMLFKTCFRCTMQIILYYVIATSAKRNLYNK